MAEKPVLMINAVSAALCPQLGGRAEGVHEERKSSSFLPGEAGDPEPLLTTGDVPAQTSAEDPQIPPAATGDPSYHLILQVISQILTNTACSA